MNHIAFIFTHGPYGITSSKEGIDLLLIVSSLSKNVGVFFILDGIFLLLKKQHPEKIPFYNFTLSLKSLLHYDINSFYVYTDSAIERGINTKINLLINVKWLNSNEWNKKLSKFNIILTF